MLTKDEVNHLVAYLIAWYHATRRPLPAGLAPYSGTVGKVKRRMIVVYQTAHHMQVTGEFDTATQKALTPIDTRAHMAARTLAYHSWAVTQHGRFIYDEFRPSSNPPPAFLYRLPRRRDCSLEGKDGAHVGGFVSPDLYSHESGYGNTDSILSWAHQHGKIRTIAQLRQADFIIYSNPGHLVTVIGPHHNDPSGILLRVASDGHQGAPEYATHAQEAAGHPGPFYGVAVD